MRDTYRLHISHFDFVRELRNAIYMFVWGVEGLAAVTFLCKTSWKNSIVFFHSLNISESCLQNIKKKQLDTKTIRIIPSLRRIRIIPSLVDGLSCIRTTVDRLPTGGGGGGVWGGGLQRNEHMMFFMDIIDM